MRLILINNVEKQNKYKNNEPLQLISYRLFE